MGGGKGEEQRWEAQSQLRAPMIPGEGRMQDAVSLSVAPSNPGQHVIQLNPDRGRDLRQRPNKKV